MLTPSQVSIEASKREKENYKFRSFLKNRANERELDKQFLALHNELFKKYDCSTCRNCCKEYAPTLKEDEMEPIVSLTGMTKEDLLNQCTYDWGEYILKGRPCRFLTADNECQIETCKPQCCRDYPHTNKPERLSSLLGVVESASVCPVVFEILERLKKRYNFKTA
jgi:Fe-S-cluster containining protein